jgi:hypothetical protein
MLEWIVIRESSNHRRQFDITPLRRLLKGMMINPRLERDDADPELLLFAINHGWHVPEI